MQSYMQEIGRTRGASSLFDKTFLPQEKILILTAALGTPVLALIYAMPIYRA
jgi:hypothetical protein